MQCVLFRLNENSSQSEQEQLKRRNDFQRSTWSLARTKLKEGLQIWPAHCAALAPGFIKNTKKPKRPEGSEKKVTITRQCRCLRRHINEELCVYADTRKRQISNQQSGVQRN